MKSRFVHDNIFKLLRHMEVNMLSMLVTTILGILQVGLFLASPFLIILVILFFKNMDKRLENIENALGLRATEDNLKIEIK